MTEPSPGPPEFPGWEPPRLAAGQTSVFHYTNAAGLLGAVQSGTLWATEAAGLNDTSEVEQGWVAIRAWLNASPHRFAKRLLQIANMADPLILGPLPPYVFCASLDGDDAGQWRLYADRGHGYSLELNTGAALSVTSSAEPQSVQAPFEAYEDDAVTYPWAAVAYEPAAIDRMMTSVIAYAESALEAVPEGDVARMHGADRACVDALYRVAACIKGPGFAGEREARVLVAFDQGDRHVDFHASAYGIVRHARLAGRGSSRARDQDIIFEARDTVAAHRKLPIRSVTLGPAHNARLAAPAVQSLLARHGYDVPVHESRVTLR